MKKHQIFIAIILGFILQSCATKTVSGISQTKEQMTSQETVPTAAQKVLLSPKLYSLLKSSKVPVKKTKYAEVIQVTDVLCKVTLPNGNRVCSFKSGAVKYTVPTHQSEQLADLLFGLNLSQGDSGVATSYIECQKFTGAEDVGCDVAMPLDYEKP